VYDRDGTISGFMLLCCNYSVLGADKTRSVSGRPTTRDAEHPGSRVLNSLIKLIYKCLEMRDGENNWR
jgi:hypothetical protein